jgi:hypothetical protein
MTDMYALVRGPFMRSKVSPLRQLGMLIALRGFGDRALKADRLLFDPIMKLKTDCLESKKFTCKLNITRWSI